MPIDGPSELTLTRGANDLSRPGSDGSLLTTITRSTASASAVIVS